MIIFTVFWSTSAHGPTSQGPPIIRQFCRISMDSDFTLIFFQALQLLEYLVKHGSERVVDDARSHISTIKMLRSFHYIDDKGKDQGINGSSALLPIL